MALGSTELARVRPPGRVEDLGVPVGLLEDLFLRRTLTERVTTIGDAAAALNISHPVANELASALREKALLEYLGVNGRDYRIQLTDLGQRTTTQRMVSGRHVSGVPVPLSLYQEVVEAQRSKVVLDRSLIKAAFEDLILEDDLLDRIGPAFVSGGAIFLYGPAGTGKTSVAERLNRIFDDPVLIPRYIETDGQIISVYDPSLHRALADQPDQLDPRWVLCERPLVIVGGELDLSMLDLYHDRISGVNIAPIQLLANNGILVVDDFGRQSVQPEAILNRWIVPLSRGVDYLKINTGMKFTVPFSVKLVISTNLDPNSLGDDAFLRRLRNKVFIGPITDAAFRAVLERTAAAQGMALAPGAIDRLCEVAIERIGELRPYLAADVCQLAVAACTYERVPNVLDPALVDRIADLYFVQAEADDLEPVPGRAAPAPVTPVTANHGPREQWRLADPAAPDHRVPAGWADYEIGAAYGDDPLAGLDALADTQSIDELGPIGDVPDALRPISHAGYGSS